MKGKRILPLALLLAAALTACSGGNRRREKDPVWNGEDQGLAA